MIFEITPNGTYGATVPTMPTPLKGILMGVMSLVTKMRGGKMLILTTTGAKSGKEHKVALGAFPDGENAWLVVASAAGAARNPAWFYNLARNPNKIWIEAGGPKVQVQAETLTGAAYDTLWKKIVAEAPGYGEYTKKTDRHIPVIRLTKKQ